MVRKSTVILIFLLICSLELNGSEIELKSGKIQQGKIIFQNDRFLKLKIFTPNGEPQILTYPKYDIVKIRNVDSLVDIYEERAQTLTPDKPADYYELGLWAAQKGHVQNAFKLFNYVACIYPPLRGDALHQLALITSSPEKKFRYLYLAFWEKPGNKEIQEKYLASFSEWEKLLIQKAEKLSSVVESVLQANPQKAWESLVEIGDIDASIYHRLSYVINSKLNIDLPELSGIILIGANKFSPKPCYKCSKNGYIKCTGCNGKGKIPCPLCNQKKNFVKTINGKELVQAPCPVCNAVGWIRCPDCPLKVKWLSKDVYEHEDFSTGRHICTNCAGTGYQFGKEFWQQNPTCLTCKGDEENCCPVCQGYGALVCSYCKGEGGQFIRSSSGYKFQECMWCQGYGRITCTSCPARRIYGKDAKSPYRYPIGTGWLHCYSCDGHGRAIPLKKSNRNIRDIPSQSLRDTVNILKNFSYLRKRGLNQLSPVMSVKNDLCDWDGLLYIDEKTVFWDGQWMTPAEKEEITKGKVPQAYSDLDWIKNVSKSLEENPINFFLDYTNEKIVPYDLLPIYRTKFVWEDKSGASPSFSSQNKNISVVFLYQKDQGFMAEVAGDANISLPDKNSLKLGDCLTLYYRILKVTWDNQEDKDGIYLRGAVIFDIIAAELNNRALFINNHD